MNYWLVKTEPECYSYEDLAKAGKDAWDGVRNFAALSSLKKMKLDDQVFVYHTGKEKAIVGVAKVVTEAYPDPDEQDRRFVAVDLEPVYRLKRAVTLKEIKENPFFAEWQLVKQSRLSVMPVSKEHWELIHHMSGTEIC